MTFSGPGSRTLPKHLETKGEISNFELSLSSQGLD